MEPVEESDSMDLATALGLAACIALILFGILSGSSITIFIDPASIFIVVGGTFAILFVAYPGGDVMAGMKAGKAAVFNEAFIAPDTIKLLSELSNRARREGLLSLEEAAEEATDDFLKRGLRMMADGHEAGTIESVLFDEIIKIGERHKVNIGIWDGLGTYAPAMGMIGTLIGLVQMLQAMSDPTAIGPAMAVALLTTFYGSLMANLLGLPIANKLKQRSKEEIAHKELIAQGLLSILNGENPRFMVERLNAQIPPSQRVTDEAA